MSHTGSGMREAVSRRDDDGVAMLTVVLLIMICAAVSVLMLGAVMSQVKPTLFAQKNTRTISAAEAGVEATLSQLRTAMGAPDAITGAVYGDPRKLPCTVQGKVGGSSATLAYSVAVAYFDESPANKDATWRAANQLTCTPGTGVAAPPSAALITSVGSDTAVPGYASAVGDRTLETIYTFKVINSAVDGGTIYSFNDDFCLQASGSSVNSTIKYVAAANCRDDAAPRMWSYGTDYAIHLAVTDLAGSTKMCIAGGASGSTVTLQVCDGGTDQKFSWRGGAEWVGQNSTNTDYSGICLGADDSSKTDLTGMLLKYSSTNCTGGNAWWKSYDPDPRVGAGPAGKATNQVVNFLEFGRCFDVTGESVTAAYMIVYPCKQDPSGGSKLKWNHKWYYSEPLSLQGTSTGTIRVSTGSSLTSGTIYCLEAPDPAGGVIYPKLETCVTGYARQQWTRTALASSGTYADSWTFTDGTPLHRCISLGDKFDGWSKMTVETCNGLPQQKWNAPANAQSASLDNFKELNN